MLQGNTVTKFAIARDLDIISDGYDTIDDAKRQLAFVNETMESLGLVPDVAIVTVDVKTQIGRAKLWVDPTPEPEPEAPEEQAPEDDPDKHPDQQQGQAPGTSE